MIQSTKTNWQWSLYKEEKDKNFRLASLLSKFSPIENIWGIMSNVMRQKDNKNQLELMDEVEKVWNGVDQEKIDNAIDSMPSRIRDLLKQNVERIDY